MIAALISLWYGDISGHVMYGLLYFSVFSCAAEVSHYLCHAPRPLAARVLAKLGIILSSKYHLRHHMQDNQQYAFLNGMTDPLIDIIAKKMHRGYKTTTDLHYGSYPGAAKK